MGCILARLSDPNTDITKPYVKQGKNSYSGGTLDEKVVNPFLHEKRIPSSAGPFLAAFRRSVRFDKATRSGLRDKQGYDSLLNLIKELAGQRHEETLKQILRYAIFRFTALRKAADIPLARLHRISLEQYGQLIEGLLETPSGGRFPVMLSEATFLALNRVFKLGWTVDVQGINVADKPSGAGADITVRQGSSTVLAAEVTERTVSKTRIVSTFQAKIAPQAIEDYLFLLIGRPDEEVIRQAQKYFSQGHEINFLDIKDWMLVILATIDRAGRAVFNQVLIERLETPGVPASLKVEWNRQIEIITAA